MIKYMMQGKIIKKKENYKKKYYNCNDFGIEMNKLNGK